MSLFQIDVEDEETNGQRHSFFLAQQLKRKGYPFQYVVPHGSLLHLRAIEAGLPVLPLKMKRKGGAITIIRMYRAMRRKNCRLVHFHDDQSVAAGSAAASLAKVQLRIITRQIEDSLKRQPLSLKKYTKGVDAILAMSHKVRRILVKDGVDSRLIKIIPSGIDFSPYEGKASSDYIHRELSLASDEYLVGIMADFGNDKKLAYVIQLMKYLREHEPKIRSIILGRGPVRMEQSLKSQAFQAKGLAFFMGFEEKMSQILKTLRVFVLSFYREDMKSLLLDAMAARLPVVATRAAGIPEVLVHRKTGLLASPRSAKYLAKGIIKLYQDPELASRLGRKGHEAVHEKFSVEAMAGRVVDLYETLAQRKGIRLRRVL